MIRYELWQDYGRSFQKRAASNLARWVAWRLPRRLVMWCYMRVGAHATTGKFGNTNVVELSMMEAIERWDESNDVTT